MSEDTVLKMAHEYNEGELVPPLPEDEVLSVVRSGNRYPAVMQHDMERVVKLAGETEQGAAQLFLDAIGETLMYSTGEKAWFVFENDRWQRRDPTRVADMVSTTVSKLILDAIPYLNDKIAQAPNKEARAAFEETAKRTMAAAYALYRYRAASAVAEFTKGKIGQERIGWDADPWLLGVANGVVDLRTGELRQARPQDLIRFHAPTPYIGLEAEAPRFVQFLRDITDDRPQREELITFLQRVFGMGLVGGQPSAAMLILYGPDGRNGKDTLAKILRRVLGPDLAGEASKGAIEAAKNRDPNSAQTSLTGLRGRRIAFVSEPKDRMTLDGALVKYITGGSTIRIRALYENETEIKATWLPTLLTNFKPKIDNVEDPALWERILMVSFNLRFVENPIEAHERKAIPFIEDTMADELPAILSWLVRGCIEYQRIGLAVPQFVKDEVNQYREEEDQVKRFIESYCTVEDGAEVKYTELEEEYRRWCDRQHIAPLTDRTFQRSLSDKGFKSTKRNGTTYRVGLRLQANSHSGFDSSFDFRRPKAA